MEIQPRAVPLLDVTPYIIKRGGGGWGGVGLFTFSRFKSVCHGF